MIRPLLDWKRYWSLRTATLRLDASGFLVDPEPYKGISLNRDVVAFPQIEGIPCLALLGEPGIGKTETLKKEYARIRLAAEASGEHTHCVDLRAIASDIMFVKRVFEAPEILAWASGTSKLHLFLDSLDECRLSLENVADVLLDGLAGLPRDRLFLRVACRTGDWPGRLENGLAEHWDKERVGVYELSPLTRRDVVVAAESEDIDGVSFLEAVEGSEAGPFASRPATLFFLLGAFKDSGQLPRSKKELYLRGCRQLCEETSESRRARRRVGSLDPEQRLIVAGRVAAAMVFCGCPAVWMGAESTEAPPEDVRMRDLVGGTETAHGNEFEIGEPAVREGLEQTGLFNSRGANRLGFAHQTYAEFLAAWYLSQHGASREQMDNLVFHGQGEGGRVVPQLHEAAAWLATMDRSIFDGIMRSDPVVLLKSDIAAAADNDKAALVSGLLELFEKDMISDGSLYRYYDKLEHPGLAEQLRPYLADTSKHVAARCAAIEIAECCRTSQLQAELADVALDNRQPAMIRVDAARAVQVIGDRDARARLKPLMMTSRDEDPDDRIRGYALKALWPEVIDAAALFAVIAPPRTPNLSASYTSFLQQDVLPHLSATDLPTALSWTEGQMSRHGGSTYVTHVVDGILERGLAHLGDPSVAGALASAIIARWRRHDHAVTQWHVPQAPEGLAVDIDQRRRLVEAIVSALPDDARRSQTWQLSRERLLLPSDFVWVLGKATTDGTPAGRRKWAKLASLVADPDNVANTDALIRAASTCQELREEFAWALQPMKLDSDAAREAREEHREAKQLRPRPRGRRGPPPSEQVVALLDRFDKSDVDAWWRLATVLEFKEDGTRGGHGFEPDLTSMPGWENASDEVRARIERAALLYLERGDPHADEWLDGDKSDWRAIAGYRALRLVLSRELADIASIESATWERWMPAILSYPNVQLEDGHRQIVKEAYAKVPSAAVDVLRRLVAREIASEHSVNVLGQMELSWDRELGAAVLKMVQEEDLPLEAVAGLLQPLLERGFDEAVAFGLTKVRAPFAPGGRERDTALAIGSVFLRAVPSAVWEVLWEGIAADPSFGEQLFLKASYGYGRRELPMTLCESLSADAISDLCIWLERHFPRDDDPDHSGSGAYTVGPRDTVADLRNGCLTYLRQAGEYEAVLKIQKALPRLAWMSWVALDAHKNMLRKTWAPVTPGELMRLLERPENRLVESGEQLLRIVLAALQNLQERLLGHTPEVRFLWNELPGRKGLWRPKDEGSFSDYVKIHLDRELRERGIIVNREVEVRRPGKGIGDRTDIHVDAVARNPRGGQLDRITVVVEVKGCWNPELHTAMEGQLIVKYLADSGSRHGLYLVGWHVCAKWDSKDTRRPPKTTIEQARKELHAQAEHLTASTPNTIRAFVLDARLP